METTYISATSALRRSGRSEVLASGPQVALETLLGEPVSQPLPEVVVVARGLF